MNPSIDPEARTADETSRAAISELEGLLERAGRRRLRVAWLEGGLVCGGLVALALGAAVLGGDAIDSIGAWLVAFGCAGLVGALWIRDPSGWRSRGGLLRDLDRRFGSGGALASVLQAPASVRAHRENPLRDALALRWLRQHARARWGRALDQPRWGLLMAPAAGFACLALALESRATSVAGEAWIQELSGALRGAVGSAGEERAPGGDGSTELSDEASGLLDRVDAWAGGRGPGSRDSTEPGLGEVVELANDLDHLIDRLPGDSPEEARAWLERSRLLAEQRVRELGGIRDSRGDPGRGRGSGGDPGTGSDPLPEPPVAEAEGSPGGNGGGSTLAEGPSAGTMSGPNSGSPGSDGPGTPSEGPPAGDPAPGDPATGRDPTEGSPGGAGTLAHAWWPAEHDSLVRTWLRRPR